VHGFLPVFQESMRVAAAVCMDWRMTNVIEGFFFLPFLLNATQANQLRKS